MCTRGRGGTRILVFFSCATRETQKQKKIEIAFEAKPILRIVIRGQNGHIFKKIGPLDSIRGAQRSFSNSSISLKYFSPKNPVYRFKIWCKIA